MARCTMYVKIGTVQFVTEESFNTEYLVQKHLTGEVKCGIHGIGQLNTRSDPNARTVVEMN